MPEKSHTAMKEDRLKILKQAPFFSALSFRALEIIHEQGIEQTFAKNEYIYFEEDRSYAVYIVLVGRVKLVKHLADGKNVIIGMVTMGEMFGESAIFDRKPYPASAQAMEKTIVLSIKRADFYIMMLSNPDIAIKLIGELGGRLRESYDLIQNLAAPNVEKRIAALLVKLAQKLGKPTSAGVKLEFDLTRQDIADMTGTTMETAIRTLSKFKKNGWVVTQQKRILIQNLAALEDIL